MTILDFKYISSGLEIGWDICPNTQSASVLLKQGYNNITMTSLQALETLEKLTTMINEAILYDIENNCLSLPKD